MEDSMPIPIETVMENQQTAKKRRDADEAERRRLERALEETFPASDAVNVTQPPHSPQDKRDKR
jgi:hypothetical protein